MNNLDILGYPSGLDIVTRVLIRERGKQDGETLRGGDGTEEEVRDEIAGFEDGRGHEPRNTDTMI